MRFKTWNRMGGTIVMVGGAFLEYVVISGLSQANANLIEILSADIPLSYKIIGATMGLGAGIYIPISLGLMADGLTDMVKGTHHYFLCRSWQKLTKSEERKKELQSYLEEQLTLASKNPERSELR